MPDPNASQDPENRWGKFCLSPTGNGNGGSAENSQNADVSLGTGGSPSSSTNSSQPYNDDSSSASGGNGDNGGSDNDSSTNAEDSPSSSSSTDSSSSAESGKDNKSNGSGKPSAPVFIGVIVGVVIVVAVVIYAVFFLRRRRRLMLMREVGTHMDEGSADGPPAHVRKSIELENDHLESGKPFTGKTASSDTDMQEPRKWPLVGAFRDLPRFMLGRDRTSDAEPPQAVPGERDSENVASWFAK